MVFFLLIIMKNFFATLLLMLICVVSTQAQNTSFTEGRYRITMKDKNKSPYSVNRPQEFLSQKAIERREKFGIAVTEQDLPVTPQYLSTISDLGAVLCNTSKWFNSAVFYIETKEIYDLVSKLTFVKNMEYVAPPIKYKNDKRNLVKQPSISQDLSIITDVNKQRAKDATILLISIYGHSIQQHIMFGTYISHVKGYYGQNMTIAVIDAGFLHVDSAAVFQKLWDENRILFTRDMTGTPKFCDTSSIFQSGSHGMMVLSLIGGFYPGKLVGTAPGANFILLRSEEEETEYRVEEDNWVAAAEVADSAGADIISTSLGYSEFDDKTQNYTYSQMNGNTSRITVGADIAASKGMLLVNSAGNSGDEKWKYITSPADADSVLTVGACKLNGKKTKFSSFGPTSDGRIKPDVMALGLYPTIVTANGTIKNSSGGTSFSCPLIAGCCATLWQEFPDSSAQAIKRVFMRSGDRYAKPNVKYGNGIPDIQKARAYFYAKEFYDKLATKYVLPDFDTFFEKIWKDGDGCNLGKDFVFMIDVGKKQYHSFVIVNHNYDEVQLPDIPGKGGKLLCMIDVKKSVSIKITPR